MKHVHVYFVSKMQCFDFTDEDCPTWAEAKKKAMFLADNAPDTTLPDVKFVTFSVVERKGVQDIDTDQPRGANCG